MIEVKNYGNIGEDGIGKCEYAYRRGSGAILVV
jgi:hypothetical protein